jgi:hypothetical protein
MADINWLFEAVKFFGTGAIAIGGDRWKNRSKTTRMRRNLYKELANNYAALWEALRVEHLEKVVTNGTLPYVLQLRYYTHAEKDMDTFHELEDYMAINSAYEFIKAVRDAKDAEVVRWVTLAKRGIEQLIIDGRLDRHLIREQASDRMRPVLDEQLSNRNIEEAGFKTL